MSEQEPVPADASPSLKRLSEINQPMLVSCRDAITFVTSLKSFTVHLAEVTLLEAAIKSIEGRAAVHSPVAERDSNGVRIHLSWEPSIHISELQRLLEMLTALKGLRSR